MARNEPSTRGGLSAAIDVIEGINQYTGRTALIQLFQQFGKINACWLPPVEFRDVERAYVKFGTVSAAQAAMEASDANLLYNHGVLIKCDWRKSFALTQDSRDFEGQGCNMACSRDIFREMAKKGGKEKKGDKEGRPGGKEDARSLMMEAKRGGGREDKDRKRDRSRSRRRRSRTRSRKRSRSRSGRKERRNAEVAPPLALQDENSDRRRSRSKRRSRSRGKDDEPLRIEDDGGDKKAEPAEPAPDFEDDELTSAVI